MLLSCLSVCLPVCLSFSLLSVCRLLMPICLFVSVRPSYIPLQAKMSCDMGFRTLYTRQKKKRTTTIFPLRSPFNTKYFPCVCPKISRRMVNEFLKRYFNATVYMEFRVCFTLAKYEKDMLSLCETTNVFIDVFS